MRRLVIALLVSAMALWSVGAMAADRIGVVDMKEIVQSSPQIKKINEQLGRQFASRRQNIMKMGQALQEQLKDYTKNKAVMSKADLDKLQAKITSEEATLRQEQAKFQQDLYAAQNKEMADFIEKVKGVVKTIAAKENLNLVLPNNAVLYSAQHVDITQTVITTLSQ